MHPVIALLLILVITGCAATYQKPTSQRPAVSAPTTAAANQIIATARKVLVSEGYQVLSADEASGTASSALRTLRLSPNEADCGTTMGLDYLKDNRTTTRVAYGIIAEPGRVSVAATIEGEYRPGSVSQDMALSCVSRGVLERALLDRIVATLPK